MLVSEGLVEPVPRRGCRVIEMTATDADELFPIMAMLEGRCAFEATQHATDADLRELRRLHDELERTAAAHDVDGYYQANHGFHSFVQRLAGNRWLDRVTADLRKFVRMLRGRQLILPGRIDASINEHRVLLAAMLERDAARAESHARSPAGPTCGAKDTEKNRIRGLLHAGPSPIRRRKASSA